MKRGGRGGLVKEGKKCVFKMFTSNKWRGSFKLIKVDSIVHNYPYQD